jgi:ubiquinone/menaquinone biosynthesis C-methylase UbiE
MASRSSNRERNRWTIDLLNIRPSDRVLEIGFGPGLAIEWLSERIVSGHVVGIDHSGVMVRQAIERNATAVKQGKVELIAGSVSALPRFEEPFDRIFSVNAVQFWSNPVDVFSNLRSLLKPDGIVATSYQPRHSGAKDQHTRAMGERIAGQLYKAGFLHIKQEFLQIRPVSVVCVIASTKQGIKTSVLSTSLPSTP